MVMPHHEGFRHEEYRSGFGNISKEAEVYGSDNKKIGEVDDFGPDYIHIKKGFLFPTELCIPNSGVSTSEANKVYLNVPSDRIEQMGWTKCPTHPGTRIGERGFEQERGFTPERPGYAPERPGYEAEAAGLAYTNIQKGWDVYCSDNNKLGNVDDITADYLLIKKGLFFGENIYVPKNAIDHIERDKVFLNVTCDKIKTLGWNRPQGGGTRFGL